ncbi:hypothetical protein [uncultured Agrobacterium sp.]|uniref:hypothetical protein n=1 Tax=uncultured Agrobacterium sp. TaxID=157277 RepID=UPI0025F256D0|nr:hypothetical protein [uncultured Agrobacterium sp.]
MTETHSKSRQQAELAFGKLQTPFFAKNHAVDELQAAVDARDAKTARLKAARLAKELADRKSVADAPATKRSKKTPSACSTS